MRIRKVNIPTIYIVLIALSLLLFVLFEWMSPKQISWQASYSPKDKIPYGTFVLKQQLPHLFPGKQVEENTKNYFEFFRDSKGQQNLIIINDEFYLDESSVNELLNYVSKGNQVFVSVEFISPFLEDTLGFSMNTSSVKFNKKKELMLVGDPTKTNLSTEHNTDYFDYFEESDEGSNFDILGIYSTGENNFIRFDIGEGSLFLHSVPLAFTNYYILDGNTTSYVEKVFSYLRLEDVVWDDYVRRKDYLTEYDLMFIASSPTLKAALYLSILLILLFMVFYGKRRQRVVAVVPPLKNDSLGFADTISKLYLQQNKHKIIAEKQIRFFMDYVRLQYHVKPELNSEKFKISLMSRSGKSEEEVTELIGFMKTINAKSAISAEELLELNQKIEQFKNQV